MNEEFYFVPDGDSCQAKTRIVTVEPQDARVGDIFTGTVEYGGATFRVTGPLKGGSYHAGDLYVSSMLPYAVKRDGTTEWTNVYIERAVPIRTRVQAVQDLAPGTVFKLTPEGPSVWVRLDDNRVRILVTSVGAHTDPRIIDRAAFGSADADDNFPYVIFDPTKELK